MLDRHPDGSLRLGLTDGNTLRLRTSPDGRTTLSILVEHETQEHRDGHIQSGMEEGMQESMDALEDVARSLA